VKYPLEQRTSAPGLEYSEVKKIALERDDFLENGTTEVSLAPGTYNLVLLDVDNYSLPAAVGESFILSVNKFEGSSKALHVLFANAKEDGVAQTITEPEESLTLQVNSIEDPPYSVSLSQDGYDDPNLYSITVSQHKKFIQHFPYLPKNRAWVGVALVNNSDRAIDNVMLTTCDASGKPLHTVLGPLTMNAHEKKTFLFDSLPYRLHEYISTKGFVLQADKNLQYVVLAGIDQGPLAGMAQNRSRGEHVVMALTRKQNTIDNIVYSFIVNDSLTDNTITIRVFSQSGELKDELTLTMAPHEKIKIIPGQGDFTALTDDGWLDINSIDGESVTAFLYNKHRNDAYALYAPAVNNDTKYIPHTPEPGLWLSTLTLINTENEENTIRIHPVLAGTDNSEDLLVTLAPFEKRAIDIGSSFGRIVGDELYHSIVEVSSAQEYAGFYTYMDLSSKEITALPLLNNLDFKQKITLPHYPGDSLWWTGIVLANNTHSTQNIHLTAYDTKGEKLTPRRDINIQPGGYETFTVKALFGSSVAKDISYVSAETTAINGRVGGIYLYGSKIINSLSGSTLQ